MGKQKNSHKKQRGSNAKKKDGGGRQPMKKRFGEVVYDPEARKTYLRGFSDRKKQRRAYGLAMQKVKDRKARLEQRAELKQAVKEQIEQAEKQKEQLMAELLGQNENAGIVSTANADAETEEKDDQAGETEVEEVRTFTDRQTKSQWGGSVIVTTSAEIPSDDDDSVPDEYIDKEANEDSGARKKRKMGVDAEQEFAGNVEKYLLELKGKMPGKKKKEHRGPVKRKGNHGAVSVVGGGKSGSATSDFKIAKKALEHSISKKKGPVGAAGGGGKKGRKGTQSKHNSKRKARR